MIGVRELVKRYGVKIAVDGLDFTVNQGDPGRTQAAR